MPLVGRLQHGWSAREGILLDDYVVRYHPQLYVWNPDNRQRMLDRGYPEHRIVRVGSPYLYLPDVDGDSLPDARGLLAIPQHTTGVRRPDVDLDIAWQPYASWLAQIAKDLSTANDVTVCLHESDFQGGVIAVFNTLGIKVACCGRAFNNPSFLLTLRDLILRHEAVTSNCMCTGILYGAFEGRQCFIGGPCISVDTRLGSDYDSRVTDPEWIAKEFPEFQESTDGHQQVECASREIGVEWCRSDLLDAWMAFRFAVPTPEWLKLIDWAARSGK